MLKLNTGLQIVTECDEPRCSPKDRREWLGALARCYASSGSPAGAVKVTKLALAIPGATREERATLKYQMGMCYWDMNYRRSAYMVMQELSSHYADTNWGAQARRVCNGWKLLEDRAKEETQQAAD